MVHKHPKILAVSSGGGHWIQMLRLRPAFKGCTVHYATVNEQCRADVPEATFHTVPDGNRDTKLSLLAMALKVLFLVIWVRPSVIISTGAAPGYFACRFAKLVGARSLFIDSVANAEDMSLSAKLATTHASKVFSQWPDVAKKFGVEWHGSVL